METIFIGCIMTIMKGNAISRRMISTVEAIVIKRHEYGRLSSRHSITKTKLHRLVDDAGRIVEKTEEVAGVAVEYFEQLFTSTRPTDFGDIMQGVEGRVTREMNEGLRAQYTGEEVVQALNQMNPLKAPRPDGMNGLFFQTYWHIVGPSVVRQVLRILNGAPMPGNMNLTHTVLIPKMKAPDKMVDFRPISLCNVLYKIVSKVLANRLKLFLGDIVSENQNVFTHGRIITDNILLAFEMFHYMKNSMDDSIYFVKANEAEARRVKVILREYEVASGKLVNFDKTTVSFSKGTREDRRRRVAAVLGVRVVNVQDRYLGLPTVVGRSKQVVTKIIRDKLSKKLQGWRGLLLSKAGREVLIKAIAQSIPTYTMSVFKLPANFCDELRAVVSKFWWGSEGGRRKMAWLAWDKLCMPKDKGGLGFRDFNKFNRALLGKQGWRLMTDENSFLTLVLKAKYFPTTEFMEAELGTNPSYTWRSIWEARDVINLAARKRIGNGMGTQVWLDPWIQESKLKFVFSPLGTADVNMRVAELLLPGGRAWNQEMVTGLFLPFEVERIMNIRLSERDQPDECCWDLTKDGNYSVKSAYWAQDGEREEWVEQSDFAREKWLWNKIWKVPVLPRIKVFFWQLCNKAIATKHNLARRLSGIAGGCPICSYDVETCLHVVRGCDWVGGVWDGLGLDTMREVGFIKVREWGEAMMREANMKDCVALMTG
ncbi:uncharacterized protein LOC141641696 [Silene latifolia]|uniref:uncharacterized protein LOC141641696 n=1 Tax=Silene latifolia TaxID=37657 RepID=UPI003D77A474